MAKTFNLGEELRKAGGGPTVDTREQIEYLDPDRIIPDPKNDYSMDGIEELAASIELVGLQQPLRVHDVEGGNYMLISGHRRREALMLLRSSGNEMFKHGFPCIRERPADIPEMQELKLIFGNAQTRVMSAPELSRQAVKTRDLLARLRDRGYDFPGRTRELVASVLQTSDSRVGRLTAIRERLVPELLTKFDSGRLGETVAYRLSQEDRTTQQIISLRLGPAVQGLTKDGVEAVIDQAKKPKETEAVKDGPPRASAPTGNDQDGAEYSAVDGLKKYLDARHDEDARFWKYMQEAADSLIQRSFSAGALPNRKDNIDMLRIDCRNAGVAGYAADWQGSNKGLTLMHLSRDGGISRTWTEVYDALAAIAITRWRAVLTEERRKPKDGPPRASAPTDTVPKWMTGEPSKDGRYLCRVAYREDGEATEATMEYKKREDGSPLSSWVFFGSPLASFAKVVGWWPLPERG